MSPQPLDNVEIDDKDCDIVFTDPGGSLSSYPIMGHWIVEKLFLLEFFYLFKQLTPTQRVPIGNCTLLVCDLGLFICSLGSEG